LKFQKIEGRVASDEDLKLSDTLRYYMRDSFAAKRLLYRRLRCLSNYENANRNLEKARTNNKDVHAVSIILLEWIIHKFKVLKSYFAIRHVSLFFGDVSYIFPAIFFCFAVLYFYAVL
jgi:hypothetical protein